MMVTSQAAAPAEHFNWNQICARYPDQWVALADIEWVNRTDFAFTGAESSRRSRSARRRRAR